MDTHCPRCQSARIVAGRCLGQADYGFGFVFRPSQLQHFAFTGTDVSINSYKTACLDCGLLWSSIDREKLMAVILKKGNKALKQKLGQASGSVRKD